MNKLVNHVSPIIVLRFMKNLFHQFVTITIVYLNKQNIIVRMTDQPKIIRVVDKIMKLMF